MPGLTRARSWGLMMTWGFVDATPTKASVSFREEAEERGDPGRQGSTCEGPGARGSTGCLLGRRQQPQEGEAPCLQQLLEVSTGVGNRREGKG